jgi:YD repeat-containing protein
MIKRTGTLTIMLLLLLTFGTGPTSRATRAADNPPSLEARTKDEVQQAIADALKNATYDAAGRLSKVVMSFKHLGHFTFEYKYDRANRLQYILDENGGRTQHDYDKAGRLERITLPDGTRMYELDKDGKGVFFKQGLGQAKSSAAQRPSASAGSVRFIKTTMAVVSEACTAAVTAAVIAAAEAVAACTGGDPLTCALATAAAASAAYGAYVVCKEAEIM